MKAVAKIVGLAVLVCFAVVVGIGAYIYVKYTPEYLAEQVKMGLNRSVPGASVDIKCIKVTLWPQPKCQIEGMRLGIKAYERPLAEADSVMAGIDLKDLLSNKVTVNRFEIKRPKLHWCNDAKLRQFIQQFQGNNASPKHNEDGGDLNVHRIDITDGSVELVNCETNESVSFDGINLEFRQTDLFDRTAKLTLELEHAGQHWHLKIRNADLNMQHPSIEKLVLTVGDMVLAAKVDMQSTPKRAVSAKVSLNQLDETFIREMMANADRIGKIVASAQSAEPAGQSAFKIPDLDLDATLALERFQSEKLSFAEFKGKVLVKEGRVQFVGGCKQANGINEPFAKISVEPENNMTYAGSISVASSNPIILLEQAGIGDINQSAGVLKTFDLSAQFSGNADELSVKSALAHLDTTQFALRAKIVNFKQPTVAFGLEIDAIDLNPYLQAFATPKQKSNPAEKQEEIPNDPWIKKLLVGGDIKVGSLTIKEYRAKSMLAHFTLKNGVLWLDPFKMRLFEGLFAGRYIADLGSDVPSYHIEHVIRGLELQQLYEQLRIDQKVEGTVDLKLRIDLQGKTPEILLESLNGYAVLDGRDVVIQGIDVDQMIDAYKRAKYMQLADMALLLTTGPLGSLASIGTRAIVTAVDATQGEKTSIRQLHALWQIDDGVAKALDVALKTPKNRIAMKGSVDLVQKRFDKVGIAVLDKQGCAAIKQQLDGPVDKLEIDYAEAAGDFMLGSVDTALELGSALIEDCPVYYKGSVK